MGLCREKESKPLVTVTVRDFHITIRTWTRHGFSTHWLAASGKVSAPLLCLFRLFFIVF